MIPRLFAFTDDRVIAEGAVADRAAEMARAGGTRFAVALRSTKLPDRELLSLACELAAAIKPYGSTLAVSGRPDIARTAGATMMLAGRGSLGVGDMKRVLQAPVLVSVHADEMRGQETRTKDADGFVAGAIYSSATHGGAHGAGLELVRAAARSGKPVIAIGGVTPARVPELLAAGAHGVASITALWDDGAAEDFLRLLPADESVGVTINGEPRRAPRGATLTALLAELSLDPRAVVVEHNRQIIRREALERTAINEGDVLELVHFVGGG